MSNIPKPIKETFERLKAETKSRMSIKRINGKYYVYKESSAYSKELHRSTSISAYIGRILENGKLVKKKESVTDNIGRIESEVRLLGGRVVWDRPSIDTEQGDVLGDNAKHKVKIGDIDRKILTCLGMDCRMSFAEMSEVVGVNQQTLYSRTKRLEKDLGIAYTCGVNGLNFGYVAFVVLIKFDRQLPDLATLKKIFANEPRIQLAGILKGHYDILALMLVESNIEADAVILKLRSDPGLQNYKSVWHLSPYLRYSGSVEHSEGFFDKMIMSRVWKRTRESPRPNPGDILRRQYAVMKEMERDGRVDFTSIDKKYGFPRGTARYTYVDLQDKGWLGRSSINVRNNNVKYTAVMLLKYTNIADFNRTKHKLVESTLKKSGEVDKYSFIGEIGSPNSLIMFMSVIDERQFYEEIKYINDNVEGIKLTTSILTNLFIGKIIQKSRDEGYLWREKNIFLTETSTAPEVHTYYKPLRTKGAPHAYRM